MQTSSASSVERNGGEETEAIGELIDFSQPTRRVALVPRSKILRHCIVDAEGKVSSSSPNHIPFYVNGIQTSAAVRLIDGDIISVGGDASFYVFSSSTALPFQPTSSSSENFNKDDKDDEMALALAEHFCPNRAALGNSFSSSSSSSKPLECLSGPSRLLAAASCSSSSSSSAEDDEMCMEKKRGRSKSSQNLLSSSSLAVPTETCSNSNADGRNLSVCAFSMLVNMIKRQCAGRGCSSAPVSETPKQLQDPTVPESSSCTADLQRHCDSAAAAVRALTPFYVSSSSSSQQPLLNTKETGDCSSLPCILPSVDEKINASSSTMTTTPLFLGGELRSATNLMASLRVKEENEGLPRTKQEEQCALSKLKNELGCSICHLPFVTASTLTCSHSFCSMCIGEWLKVHQTCPNCRATITQPPVRSRIIDKAVEIAIQHVDDETMQEWLKRQRAQAELEAQQMKVLESLIERAKNEKNNWKFMSITNRWSCQEKARFINNVSKQLGEARVAYCALVGLTPEFVGRATAAELLAAAHNISLSLPSRATGNSGASATPHPCPSMMKEPCLAKLRARLNMFIHVG